VRSQPLAQDSAMLTCSEQIHRPGSKGVAKESPWGMVQATFACQLFPEEPYAQCRRECRRSKEINESGASRGVCEAAYGE